MAHKLHISSDLSLPPDVVTSTTVVYGGKGMGKTNLGSVLIEELTKAGLRWCLLDPMGVSWGLRYAKDGKGPSNVPCVILGGAHGDIPIEPTGGAIVADLVVDENANVIIDFSRKANGQMWSLGEKVRFVTDYALRLFQRQGELVGGRRREPLIQILDEAARYIPQVIPHGAVDLAKSVGAWEQICEEGRNIGLGVAFLTQRSARMNKSVSELADVMFAFRTIGPNSLAAVMDWLGEHVEKGKVKDLAAKVRELEVGHALVVSPGWLKVEKIAHIRERETFDSSATPKAGQTQQKVTGQAAKPDLAKYQERMAATIEKAKADDPKALRAEIASLRKQLAAPTRGGKTIIPHEVAASQINAAVTATRRESAAAIAKLAREVTSLCRVQDRLIVGIRRTAATLEDLCIKAGQDVEAIGREAAAEKPAPTNAEWHRVSHPSEVRPATVRAMKRAASEGPSDGSLAPARQRILNAIADLNALGIEQPSRGNVGAWIGIAASGGSFRNNLGALRSAGLIDYPADDLVVLTDAGAGQAETGGGPQSLDELHSVWLRKLPPAKAKILGVLLNAYPAPVTRHEIGAEIGVEPTGGSFRNALGAMRSLGLIDYPSDGTVVATSLMFPEGLR